METVDDPDDARPDSDARPGGDAGPPERQDRPSLEVSGTQVCASALASVSAAVIGSFFGVADTLIGAAIASVVATLGSAVYSLWIRRGSQKLKDAEVTSLTALTRVGAVKPSPRRSPVAVGAPEDADDCDHDPRDPPAWWAWLAQRRRSALAGVAIVFLVTVGVITAAELVARRPLAGVADGDSSGTTSIGQVFQGDSSGSGTGTDEPATTATTVGAGTSTPGGAPDTAGGGGTTTTTAAPDGASGAPEPGPDDGTTTTTSDGSTTSSTTAASAPSSDGSGGSGGSGTGAAAG